MSNGLWWLLALYHHCQAVSGVTALNSRFPSDDSRHVLLLAAACAGSGRGRKDPRGKHLALPQHTPSCLLRTLAPPERVFAPAARAAPAPRGAGRVTRPGRPEASGGAQGARGCSAEDTAGHAGHHVTAAAEQDGDGDKPQRPLD